MKIVLLLVINAILVIIFLMESAINVIEILRVCWIINKMQKNVRITNSFSKKIVMINEKISNIDSVFLLILNACNSPYTTCKDNSSNCLICHIIIICQKYQVNCAECTEAEVKEKKHSKLHLVHKPIEKKEHKILVIGSIKANNQKVEIMQEQLQYYTQILFLLGNREIITKSFPFMNEDIIKFSTRIKIKRTRKREHWWRSTIRYS